MSDDNLSDEEYFRLMMQAVKPLRQTKSKHHRVKSNNTPVINIHKTQVSQILPDNFNNKIYSYTNYNNPIASEETMVYYKNALANNQRKKLQQGQITIQAKLDLHGLTLDQAHNAVCDFIQQQSNLDHRYVLIIHGKGSLHHEMPILKNHVNNWLQQFPQVLAFHSAHRRHGGAGAVYVLLKHEY